MSDNSTYVPSEVKTIFNTLQLDFRESLKALSRVQVECLAADKCLTLCILYENIIELKTTNPTLEKVHEIVADMMEIISDDKIEHEVFYAGRPREILLKHFPSLRGEGDVA